MKIKEIEVISHALALINTSSLPQSVRVKVVLLATRVEKAVMAYQSDARAALARLKPEGFDEKLKKFEIAFKESPEGDEVRQAEMLRADADFPAFKSVYDSVSGDYKAAQDALQEQNDYPFELIPFSVADWEAIGSTLPADGKTTVQMLTPEGFQDVEMNNDFILKLIMSALQ